jgi:hypothetical protein
MISVAVMFFREIKREFELAAILDQDLTFNADIPVAPWTLVLKIVTIALSVSTAVLGFGIALRWAFDGFRATEKTSN